MDNLARVDNLTRICLLAQGFKFWLESSLDYVDCLSSLLAMVMPPCAVAGKWQQPRVVAEDQSQSQSRWRRMRERRAAARQAQLISLEIQKSFEQVALRADADEFIPS